MMVQLRPSLNLTTFFPICLWQKNANRLGNDFVQRFESHEHGARKGLRSSVDAVIEEVRTLLNNPAASTLRLLRNLFYLVVSFTEQAGRIGV